MAKMNQDDAIAAMLGGASEGAALRGGGHGARLGAAALKLPQPKPGPTPMANAVYYDNDSSTGLRLVQVQVVACAEVMVPQDLLKGQSQGLAKVMHRGKEDWSDAEMLASAARQSPLLGSAAGRGIRGLAGANAKHLSAASCDSMRRLGVTLRKDLVNKRPFLPPGVAEGMDTLSLLEVVAGGTESCMNAAQLMLDGLYPAECRAAAKMTTVDWDEDTSPLLQTPSAAAVHSNAFSAFVDVVTATPEAAEAALDGALAEGLLGELGAATPAQLARLDDLLHCFQLSGGLAWSGAAGKTLAGMVANARTKRSGASAEGGTLAAALKEAFTETMEELAVEEGRAFGAPRLCLMVAERDALSGLVAALELQIASTEPEAGGDGVVPEPFVGRGECLQLELWCDEASSGEEDGGYLVSVSHSGVPIKSLRHFGALIPLGKLFDAPLSKAAVALSAVK